MCLAATPGFVFINTKVIRTQGLESFYTFWVGNKDTIKSQKCGLAIIDSANSLVELKLGRLVKAYKAGDFDELVDPVRVPILANFQPKIAQKPNRSISKENKVPKSIKSNKDDQRPSATRDPARIFKTTAPLPINFSTSTNALYNNLSHIIREPQQNA